MRQLLAAAFAAAIIATLGASMVLGGEVTGNGKLLHFEGKWGTGLHARSVCAYSGQEDLQFFIDEEGDTIRVDVVVKGEPGHSQSWGQIPKDVRDFLTSIGSNPGLACNPIK